jgi:fatty-acyl-CoA synthase
MDDLAPMGASLSTLALMAKSSEGDGFVATSVAPSATALVQYTSGSTSSPKGVVISYGQLARHVIAIQRGTDLVSGRDVLMSWLPLSHDMGLIGFLCVPMALGLDLVLLDPSVFVRAPRSWMELVSRHRCTVTGAPNFAYALATRGLSGDQLLDLSHLRVVLNGAEPIDAATVERFVAAGARHGLKAEAMFCVYGMAESTLAVSFPKPGVGMTLDTVDPIALEVDGRALPRSDGRRLVKLGMPLEDADIRITEPRTGAIVPERVVGEIEILGPCVTSGYLEAERNEGLFNGKWLRTGDLGYMAEGELVVCGRLKDVIIIAGRNVFPEDIERAAGSVDHIRKGNVIAFGQHNGITENIVIAAESRERDDMTRRAVAAAVFRAVGISPADIILVRPGALPKTPSGKLQRSRCKQRYETGTLASTSSNEANT